MGVHAGLKTLSTRCAYPLSKQRAEDQEIQAPDRPKKRSRTPLARGWSASRPRARSRHSKSPRPPPAGQRLCGSSARRRGHANEELIRLLRAATKDTKSRLPRARKAYASPERKSVV